MYLQGFKSVFQVVSKEAGEALAENYKIQFLESSAKSRHNVNEIFSMLSKEILEYRKTVSNMSGNNINSTVEPTDLNINLQEKRTGDALKKKDKSCANKCCNNQYISIRWKMSVVLLTLSSLFACMIHIDCKFGLQIQCLLYFITIQIIIQRNLSFTKYGHSV